MKIKLLLKDKYTPIILGLLFIIGVTLYPRYEWSYNRYYPHSYQRNYLFSPGQEKMYNRYFFQRHLIYSNLFLEYILIFSFFTGYYILIKKRKQ